MDDARRKRLEDTTRYIPGEVEGRVFASWEEGGYFTPEAAGSPEENYSIAIPLPNVTGSLHMGHGLNNSIQDLLIRKARMEGRRAKWIIGTDHAGIATQSVVEKELRKQGIERRELGREKFVERVWEWRDDYGGRIIEQLKRIGASGDFANERFTLDEGYVRAVRKVFVALYEKGLIYRDNYMVNWDPGSRSAISDLEVENREVTDVLFHIDYPVEGSDRVLTVATVRPETMLGDTAIAVHPDDQRYKDVVGSHCVLPLVGRRLPIIADPYVDPEFGTGALKITPGHDPNDFDIGRAHGLDEISVIAEDGTMNENAGKRYQGLSAANAQEKVVADLREKGSISAEEDYTHSVPFSHRSGERIEPLISLQWFCRMDELAKPAIDVVRGGDVTFTPERWGRVYLDWMENIRPWCVSRQLWWGHQIPVWYCDACNETIVAEGAPDGCPKCGAAAAELRQDPDVLDTWFSSALFPFAALGWPDETAELKAFYPTDVLVTGRDIIYLWVARMIMSGIEFLDQIPFSDVYINSIIQAPDGRRMSKSLGTGLDPLELIDSHGADALRFGLLAMSSSQDVRFSEAKVQQGRDLSNKLWNASRFALLNAGDATPGPSEATIEDRWILSRLERTVGLVGERIEAYDFAHAALELYRFIYSELCDWYLEIVKPRLYETADGDPDAAGNLLHVIERTLALAHPLMPFVTEEIWSYLPDRDKQLIVSAFPAADEARIDADAEAEVERAIETTRALRRWRELAGVSPSVTLNARPAAGADAPHPLVGRLARFDVDGGSGEAIASVGAIDVLASAELDADAVAERMAELRKKLESEVARAEGKLANEKFVANAPADVVDEEREKLERYRADLAELSG